MTAVAPKKVWLFNTHAGVLFLFKTHELQIRYEFTNKNGQFVDLYCIRNLWT